MKPINAVLVRVEEDYDFQTESGIFTSVKGHNDTEYVRIHGVVTGVPRQLTGPFCGHIDPIVEIGDKVYFHYLGKREEVKEREFIIDYFNIFCVVRDGKIIPVGDWALFEPHYDEKVEKVFLNEKLGYVDAVVSETGLIKTAKPKHSAIRARVCYIEGEEGVAPGDLVYLIPKFEFRNTIEGKEYFLSKKEYILGKQE